MASVKKITKRKRKERKRKENIPTTKDAQPPRDQRRESRPDAFFNTFPCMRVRAHWK